jgi:hypothetical protein
MAEIRFITSAVSAMVPIALGYEPEESEKFYNFVRKDFFKCARKRATIVMQVS